MLEKQTKNNKIAKVPLRITRTIGEIWGMLGGA